MLDWMEGVPLSSVPMTPELCRDAGYKLGLVDLGLRDFDDPDWKPDILWDLSRAAQIRPLFDTLDPELQDLARRQLDAFESRILPAAQATRQHFIHNDLNPHNAVVDPRRPNEVAGLLDFGDAVRCPVIFDLVVATSYCIGVEGHEPLALAVKLLEGFHASYGLRHDEVALLRELVIMRLILAITVSTSRARKHPEHAGYILRNLGRATGSLRQILSIPTGLVDQAFLSVCDKEHSA